MKNDVFSIVLSMIMAFLNCHASGQNNDSIRMEHQVVMLGDLLSGVYGYSVRCGSNIFDGKLVVVR